jgi:hypothetical protein
VFRTKGELATGILAEAFTDGTAVDFVCGAVDIRTAPAPSCGSSSKTATKAACCGFRAVSTSRWRAGSP